MGRARQPPASAGLLDPDRWPRAIAIYTLVAGVSCFWRLGATGLMSMEGMVVDGGRRMLATGDWLVPHVYGELYTYKPALAYWLASLPLRLAEQPPEWLLRLPFAGAGFAMGLAVLLLVGRVAGSRVGLASALASVGGVLFIQKTRLAEFDLVTAAGVGLAVAAACANLAAERPRGGLWLLAYLGLTAGLLAKGAPALMAFGPGLLVAGLASGRFGRLWHWRHLAAALVFVLLAGGYLWAVWESAGPRAFEQPLLEARLRSLGPAERAAGDPPPSADELSLAERVEDPGASPLRTLGLVLAKPVLILGALLPWSVLVPFAFERRRWRGADPVDRLTLAAGAFLVAGTLTFMAVPTHETRYYLPLCVPAAILAGIVVGRGLDGDERRARIAWWLSLATSGLFVAGGLLAGLVVLDTPPVPWAGRLAIALVAAGGGVALYLVGRRPAAERVAVALVIASLCFVAVEFLGIQPHRARKRDLRPQAEALARHLPADATVWVLGPADAAGKHASLYFYLDRPVRAFLPGGGPLPEPAYCLLTAEGVEVIARSPEVVFRELGRAEHPWWSYRVGLCGPAAGAAAA